MELESTKTMKRMFLKENQCGFQDQRKMGYREAKANVYYVQFGLICLILQIILHPAQLLLQCCISSIRNKSKKI